MSRLDRLFLLLENGSTPLTRSLAAEQIGQVAQLYKEECASFLIRVICFYYLINHCIVVTYLVAVKNLGYSNCSSPSD